MAIRAPSELIKAMFLTTCSIARDCVTKCFFPRIRAFDNAVFVLFVPRPEKSTNSCGREVSTCLLVRSAFHLDVLMSWVLDVMVVNPIFYEASLKIYYLFVISSEGALIAITPYDYPQGKATFWAHSCPRQQPEHKCYDDFGDYDCNKDWNNWDHTKCQLTWKVKWHRMSNDTECQMT